MIIEKLTLSNWLSYPDKWVTNGNPEKPCLNFQNHPSYVIFGKNGTGKSSVMEAILFALFGDYSRTLDYRGTKRQGINNDNAIRSGENSATIDLVFSLNGRRHSIHRILNQRGSNKAYFSMWDAEKGDWSLQKSGVTAVNKTIASLIGMKRDLFCGTVVLEQGKAGRFMELKAKEQVDYVINLLGLDIYARYYEQAKTLSNAKKRQATEIEKNDLPPLADASDEAVTAAEKAVAEQQKVLDKTDAKISKLTTLQANVKAVSGLRQQIDRINSQIDAYDSQLAQKDEIETAVQIIKEWEQIEPKLRKVQQDVKQYTEQQNRVTKVETDLKKAKEGTETAKTTLSELEPKHKQARSQREAYENSLPELNEKYDKVKQRRTLIVAERNLDSRESELRILQDERKPKLAEWASVEKNYYLRDELWQAGVELKEIVTLLQNNEKELKEVNKAKQTLVERQTSWQNRQNAWVQEQERIKTITAEVATQQKNALQLEQTLRTNRTLLQRREKAHGQSTCPTCGTKMEGKVLDLFHQELAELRQQIDEGAKNWKDAAQEARDLEAQLTTRKQEANTEKENLTREKSELDSELRHERIRRVQVGKNKQEAEQRWQNLLSTLDYATEIIIAPTEACLDHAREVLKTVNNANQVYSDLQKVQAQFDSTQEELDRIKAQRKHPFETFNQIQQKEIENEVSELVTGIQKTNEQLKSCRASERSLWQQLTRAKEQFATFDRQIQMIQTETLPRETQILTDAIVEKNSLMRSLKPERGS